MPQAFVDIRLRCAGGSLLFRPHRSDVGSEVAARPMADKAKLRGYEMAGSGNRADGRGIRESFVSNLLIASILPSFGERRNGEKPELTFSRWRPEFCGSQVVVVAVVISFRPPSSVGFRFGYPAEDGVVQAWTLPQPSERLANRIKS